MAALWNLKVLILFIAIPQHYYQYQYHQPNKIKREAADDHQVDRFIRSNSKNSKQVGDLIMIMDISTSLNDTDRKRQRQTLGNLGRSKVINIGKDNVRIGIIAFETQAHMILHLDEGVTGQAVIDAAEKVNLQQLTSVQKTRGTTNFPDAMNLAKKEFQDKGRSGNIIRVALLVTDGQENCAPFQTRDSDNCPRKKDCNEIAEKCPRPSPPGDLCCGLIGTDKSPIPCVKSAVYGEFRDLKNESVTLAIIGVGWQVAQVTRDRRVCWATEELYKETPSYAELEKTVEELLTQIIPLDPANDCKWTYNHTDICRLYENGKCGRYSHIIIRQHPSGTGRPCPNETKWSYCPYKACNVTFGEEDYTDHPVVVIPTTPAGASSEIAWWVIFVILLGILAVILCVVILLVAIIRRKRKRRLITTGVQPSIIQPVSVGPECQTKTQQRVTPVPVGGITGAGRSVEKSRSGVSKRAQASTKFLGSQQKSGTKGGFQKASVSRPVSSQTEQQRDMAVQPGTSLMPTSAARWGSFDKTPSKKK